MSGRGWKRPAARRIGLALALGLCAWLAGPPTGPLAAQVDRPTIEDRADVTLVELPLVALDRRGRPVRGLRPEQLRLRIDDVERPVERLEVVDLAALEDLETFEALERIPTAARRRFLLLFDLELSSPRALLAARREAVALIARHLRPTDLVAVATLDGRRGVRWLMTFSGDRRQLARSIETLGVPGLVRPPPRPDPLRFTLDLEPPGESSGADPSSARRFDADMLRHLERLDGLRTTADRARRVERIERWARALGSLGDALGAVDGRTQVLLFSEGFDASLGYGASGAGGRWLDGSEESADSSERLFGSPALRAELDDSLARLRRSDAVLHAIDPGGLRSGGDSTAATPEIGRASADLRRSDSLFHLADATGGRLIEDAGRFGDALAELVASSEVVYLLSFHLPDDFARGDAASVERTLTVETDVPDVVLRYRSEIRPAAPFADLPAVERELLAADDLLDARPRVELPLEMLAAPFPTGGASAYVPLVLELPTPPSGRPDAASRFEIYVLALDDDGAVAGVHAQTLEIDSAALSSADRLQYYGHLELPPGPHALRALMRDLADGRTGTASQALEVPSWSEPFLLPPLLPDDADGAVRASEARVEADADTPRVYPFVVNGRGYVPSPRPTLRVGVARRIVVLCSGLDDAATALELRLVRADGSEAPSTEVSVEVTIDEPAPAPRRGSPRRGPLRRSPLRQWTATITVDPSTPAGVYSLVATVNGLSASTEVTVER